MLVLALHPTETRQARHQVRASARKIAGQKLMTLRFEIIGSGNISCQLSEHDVASQRLDDLWKSTCFECFIAGASDNYQEWNFAPNGNWNAYDFDSYRKEMQPANVQPPSIARTSTSDRARFEIDFSVGEELSFEVLKISLTAVVLEKGDDKPFYWALSHAGAKSDFHLRESFTLELGS